MSKRKKRPNSSAMTDRITLTHRGAGRDLIPGDVVTTTGLAVLMGVSEVTLRRYLKDKRVPPPKKFFRSVFWDYAVAERIAAAGPQPIGTYADTSDNV